MTSEPLAAAPLPRAGRILDGVHHYPVRVYYEDTDAGGIVYYANYLKFAERARSEMLRCCGIEHARLQREAGLALVVRRAALEFLAPARLDDDLAVLSRVLSHAGAALVIGQEIRRGGACLTRIECRIACVTAAGRPTRLPPALVAALASLSRQNPRMVPAHAH